jgi:hypothetical protein
VEKMENESFFQAIIERLNQPLDGMLFQECISDLLREIYPGMVSYRGGDDAGMDGAIPDGEGFPYPLIVTTSEDAIGNLTRNLKSYKEKIGKSNKAVFVTSKKLTMHRIRNLNKRAEELGFILVGVHTQEDIARYFYRNPEWCKNLLGLTGIPAPLSTIPKSTRPLIDSSLIGREKDLQWLKESKGERLLIGQPGSGKTFLLYKLAQETGALFVVSNDLEEIANQIRKESPSLLMVDDAQFSQGLLPDLIHLRTEIKANFEILATCWPGEKDNVSAILGVPESNIRQLGLLTRDEIVKVVNEADIIGSNELIREIVNQAEGRPGLAVTLSRLCLFGDMDDVLSGDALRRSITQSFPKDISKNLTTILASFGIGGDFGMPVDVIRSFLEIPRLDVGKYLSELAPNGVVQERSQGILAVRPIAFRDSLIKEIFFEPPSFLNIERLLEISINKHATLHMLINVKARGANVPNKLLLNLLEQTGWNDAWLRFAMLGKVETNWVLSNKPELIIAIAPAALENNPNQAIPMLLQRAIGDQRNTASYPDHPMRLIQDWVHSGHRPEGEGIRRRRHLLTSTREWFNKGGDPLIVNQAICLCLSPKVEFHETDPGLGDRFTLHYGYLELNSLVELGKIWSEAFALLKEVKVLDWANLSSLIREWGFHYFRDIDLPEEMKKRMKSFAIKMLQDLIPLISVHPGMSQSAKEIAILLGVDLQIEIDPIFEVFYPTSKPLGKIENDQIETEKQIQAVKDLATQWSQRPSKEVAHQLLEIKEEARLAEKYWPNYVPFLCQQIAQLVASPKEWGTSFLAVGATSEMIEPFLIKSSQADESVWQGLVGSCLDNPSTALAAINTIFTLSAPPEDLLTRAISMGEPFADAVETLSSRGQIPISTLKSILRSEIEELARATVCGMWVRHSKDGIPAEIFSDWKRVVLLDTSNKYLLGDILKHEPEIAYDWIQRILSIEHIRFFANEEPLRSALSGLAQIDKIRLIEGLEMSHVSGLIVELICEDNPDLYEHVLGNKKIEPLHLYPLIGDINSNWIEMAKKAFDYGYSVEEISRMPYSIGERTKAWIGNPSEKWKKCYESFDSLCTNSDPRIQKIGETGKRDAGVELSMALDRERKRSIYGSGY